MLTTLGPFQILEVIGRGGMGTVYRAIDPIIRRPVAVKVIRLVGYNDVDEQTWLKERLFREARAAGCLNHPGIVTIYQVGEEEDVAYIAMEFVDGSTMQDLMVRQDPLDKLGLCRVVRDAAAALDHAHECGLVHRDIKPANIMVTVAGKTKVTDFGIAKTSFGLTTKTGMILGTPCYMSPEQIRGEVLDGRSDQFSLAVVAYEVLTGRRPFDAELPTSICYQIVHQDPISPEDIDPSLGPEVAAVIKRGLAKNPSARYSTCTEFAEALMNEFTASSKSPGPILAAPVTVNPGPPGSIKAIPASASIGVANKKSYNLSVGAIALGAAVIAGVLLVSVKGIQFTRPPSQDGQSDASAIPSPVPNKSPEGPTVPSTPKSMAGTVLGSSTVAESIEVKPPIIKKLREESPESNRTTEPKPTPRDETKALMPKGMMIWTGRLAKGGLVTITREHPSSGLLTGAFPGIPVDILIYPAEVDKTGLTVFTSDPQYATPRIFKTARGDATFTFDPRHATDIAIFEAPGPQNNWARLVMRFNNPKVEACVIEWSGEP